MADIFTPEKRSEVMSKIRSKWTKPEKMIHNYLKGHKIRHTMHPKIAGNPDVLLVDRNVAMFIHGCFWHKCPKHYKEPKSRKEYWIPKIESNVKRDTLNARAIRKSGYKVMRVWEHDIGKNGIQRVIERCSGSV